MKLPRPIVLVSALGAAVLIGAFCGILLLPRLIDSQTIRNKIISELEKKTKGRVTLGKIAFLGFPRPAVQLDNARVSFDDQSQGSIQTATIYPSILYLLLGRVVVHRAVLQTAKFDIRLPGRLEQRFDLEELEEAIRSALVRLAGEAPLSRIDLSEGSAEIRIADRPPVILENIAARTAVGSPAKLQFEIAARSNLWTRFKIQGEISAENLATQLDIGVYRLKVKEILSFIPARFSDHTPQGEASFDIKIESVGLRQITASIDGVAGPLLLGPRGSTAKLEAKRLKGGLIYDRGRLQIGIRQLDLSSPRLQATGDLKIDSGNVSARITVRRADVAEVGQAALRIMDDSESVKRAVHYFQSGTIDELHFQSAGRSVLEMASGRNVILSGRLRGCRIFVPAADLELQDVTGSVRMSGGILEADGISGNLGTAKGWNGKLRFGLGGRERPFHLDILLHTGAAELQAVLLRLVRDRAVREELLKVRNVEGELSGRLVLGETLDAFSPVITVSKANLSGHYDPVPFPIAIRSGFFTYNQKVIELQGVQGSVGRSDFGGLGVTLRRDGSRRIKVDSGRVSLDLQETGALLRSFKNFRSRFEKLQIVRGHTELQNLTFSGPYDNPWKWTFAGAGRFDQVEISHADFPGRIALSRGKFDINQDRAMLFDASAAISDASWNGGATLQYGNARPVDCEMSGTATLGPQITQWLRSYVELRDDLNLRAPLEVAAKRLAWREGGEISFLGQVTVAGGARVSVDAVKQPHALALRDLTIADGERRAQMTFQLAKDHLFGSFSGELTQETIDKLFAGFPMKASRLQGDLRARVALAGPFSVSARGRLSATNLLIPAKTDSAVIEKIDIEAEGESVQVRSAHLLWRKSRLALSGNITAAKDFLRLDLDLTGDQLDWQQIQRVFSGENGQRQQRESRLTLPEVQGTLRLKADRFTSGHLNVSPIETTVVIAPSAISAEIHRGVVCGINATGRVEFADKDIMLDLQLGAINAQLEPTTTCLTNQENDVKGTYSLVARVTGQGHRQHLRSTLKGNFQLSAWDGEFVRSPGIDATFDYLNSTGDFKVAFPDLDKETFPYRLLSMKGRIQGQMLIGDEIDVQSSLFNLSGQGRVDLGQRQIDGKGLIAVLKPVDEVIARIPFIGSSLRGSLVGIPVRVTGPLERPAVVYLSPADVGAELLNIPLRILGLPLGAVRLFTPSQKPRDNNRGQ